MRTGKALSACERILKCRVTLFSRTEGEKVLYYKADLSVQRFDRLKRNLRNFTIRADEEVNASTMGAFSSRVSYRAFSGPLLKHGRRLRPLSFSREQNQGHGEKE